MQSRMKKIGPEERAVDSMKAEDKSAFLGSTSILNFLGGEALAQTTQRSSGCPIPGDVQSQFWALMGPWAA